VDVAQLAASTPRLLQEPGALDGRLAGSSLLVQVVDRQGRIVARSGGLGSLVLPLDAAGRAALRDRRAAYGDARLGSEPIRLYAAPLGSLGQGPAAGGAVLVAGTTSEIGATLAATRRFVLLAGLACVLLAAAVATWLTRHALRPLGRLSAGARAIAATGDASRRLPPPDVRDEVGALADTLNAMLASLERAREAERRFLADASHELRTPVTALRGNAAFIASHGADPEVLADLEADAARLGTLIDDLLALAREEAAAPLPDTPVDLAEVARAAAREDPEGRVELEPGAPVVVAGDRAGLERAAGNLVRNARLHGPPGGAIRISVAGGDGRARLTVADAGAGLPAAEAAHAFERFWRGAAAPAGGTGLGLAIVRAVAERHGGHASVDGARFTIELPLLTDLSRNTDTTSP
jgi:signal transduction histidine kinase